jgi:ATP-binding cassette subfamily B protein
MAAAPQTLRTIRSAASLVWSGGRWEVVVIAGATIVSAVALAGELLAGRQILNLLTGPGEVTLADLAPYIAALGVLLVVAALSTAAAAELRVLLSERVHRQVTREVLDVATGVDLEAYEGPEFHDRLRRAQADAGHNANLVVWGMVNLAGTMATAVAVMGVLLAVAPLLVPVAAVAYLPIAAINVRNNRALYRLEWDLTELSRRRDYLERLLTHRNEAKEVRAYGFARRVRQWHDEAWQERLSRLGRLIRQRLALTMVGSGITSAVLVATLTLTLALAVTGRIGVGDAAVAVVGLHQLSARLKAASTAVASIHQGVTFLRDFDSFRALLPVLQAERPTGTPPSQPRHLQVDGVGYRYPGASHDALVSVSFELRRGQSLAIVGANGSGKSTLAKLLCGLLPPSRGVIRWDGVDLATCDPDQVRRRISPVFQDFARFELALRHAIGLGDVDRLDDLDAIRLAADHAGMLDVLESLPDGADTVLGKAFTGGTDLSIGQWQRVAIARAYFRDAPIVIFDEPSASLDPKAESDLFDRLQALCRDRIVIYVSHRFATVRSADLVLVMDGGQVVESGPHEALMANGGLYRDLFNLQADRYGLTT